MKAKFRIKQWAITKGNSAKVGSAGNKGKIRQCHHNLRDSNQLQTKSVKLRTLKTYFSEKKQKFAHDSLLDCSLDCIRVMPLT